MPIASVRVRMRMPSFPAIGDALTAACRGEGKGILIHRLTDAAGMPLASRTTPANGPDRA
jgi:hypothetical protein